MKQNQRTFWHAAVPQSIRLKIQAGAVCGYLSAGITAMGALFYSPLLWLDVLLMLSLTLSMHLLQSRVGSVILCVYFLFSKFTQFLAGGGFGGLPGVVLAIAFIGAAIGTFQFHALWQSHLSQSFWD